MKEIDKLRKKIDKIDEEILNLFSKRSEVVINIGKEKKSQNLFRPERQSLILHQLLKNKKKKIKPQFILSLWRSIFLSQIDLQGGIKILVLKHISKIHIREIYDYFSHDVNISKIDDVRHGIEKVNIDNNTLLILPYPGNTKYTNWWARKNLGKVYVSNALPFFLREDKRPSLVVLSKYKSIIKKDFYVLYSSKNLLKNTDLILEAKTSDYFLYKSYHIIKNRNLRLLGVLPKHYEIKK